MDGDRDGEFSIWGGDADIFGVHMVGLFRVNAGDRVGD